MSNTPKPRRWRPFKYKAPRYHDPADAVFEVKLLSGQVLRDCVWMATAINWKPILIDIEIFHVEVQGIWIAILPASVTHYRRQ